MEDTLPAFVASSCYGGAGSTRSPEDTRRKEGRLPVLRRSLLRRKDHAVGLLPYVFRLVRNKPSRYGKTSRRRSFATLGLKRTGEE